MHEVSIPGFTVPLPCRSTSPRVKSDPAYTTPGALQAPGRAKAGPACKALNLDSLQGKVEGPELGADILLGARDGPRDLRFEKKNKYVPKYTRKKK